MDFEFQYASDRAPLRLLARPLPLVPELCLYLFPDNLPQDKLAQEDFHSLLQAPPYWAFCWGGGQALARCLFDEPHRVTGRRVWDFGAGSGIAGVAALKVGATSGVAVDTDPLALRACELNARLNLVGPLVVTDVCVPEAGDLVLAADICYEEEGLEQVRAWAAAGVSVLLAESRLDQRRLRIPGLSPLRSYRVRTFPDLEEAEQFDNVSLFLVNP